MYGDGPSTVPEAGRSTDLRLILCTPPRILSGLPGDKSRQPRDPLRCCAPSGLCTACHCWSLGEYHRASGSLRPW